MHYYRKIHFLGKCYLLFEYLALALLAAIAGVAMLKDEKKFVFDPPQRHLTPKENYVTFFFSPGFILFALLYLYKALTYVF